MHPLQNNTSDLFVVAIGASAGGLEAIHEFFDHTPDSTNLCFVLIQHLSSDYKSLLVELVAKHTHMQVQEAKHQLPVQAGFVFVIPNDKMLTIAEGKLLLTEKENEKGPNVAIDTFLYSLAEDQGEQAIAVILSGTGTDGTKGAEAVKARGGLVLVQDPASAKFDGMPRSVIASGCADFVLPPRSMAEAIYDFMDGHSVLSPVNSNKQAESVGSILQAVRQHTGYDFHQYKPATILRRISRRMLYTRAKDMAHYEQILRQSSDESQNLAKEFFIGVTSFFRDREAFDCLYQQVFPQLVAEKNNGDLIKIWVTACSTGQEAYSIAMLLDQFLQRQEKLIDVKIFATDIDERAVEVASKGKYPLSEMGSIDNEILNQYFIRHANEVTVVPHIRKQIVFARHNILKDPPFIKNDLVTCRNLLIYLNSNLQQSVLSTLNFSLKKGGFLFLGSSENPSIIKEELEEVNGKWKIYRKDKSAFLLTRNTQPSYPVKAALQAPGSLLRKEKVNSATQLAEDFKNALVEDFGFAALYINENYEVKEVVGDFRRYLSLPDKLVNLNLLRMVPAELSGILSTAFRKVLKENKKTVLKNVRIREKENSRVLNIIIQPPAATTAQHYLMVLFGEVADSVRFNTSEADSSLLQQGSYIQELEEELKETRSNLQMAIEGLETTNEELQSANEELQSANEELQSSNEELQSLNEELHTLNTEHQLRIKELMELNDDLNNYFRSTEIGQLFLDSSLHIRKFNKAAAQVVNVIESDIGRPLGNISTNIRFSDLVGEARQVLEQKNTVEKEVELNNGKVCLMKVLPYVRQDGATDGVVLTFVDVTLVKELNSIVNGVFETISSAILVFETVLNEKKTPVDFVCKTANYAAGELFGRNHTQLAGHSLRQNFSLFDGVLSFDRVAAIVEKNDSLHTEIPLQLNGRTEWFSVVGNRLGNGIILAFTKITELKESEEKLRRNYNELLRTKESLKELNAQLEQKVEERTKDLAQSEERFRLVASATNDAIWDWNFAGNTVWWSESFYLLFGYDRNDPQVGTSSFWIESIHPDDRQRVKEGIHAVINGSERLWNAECRFRKADGSYAIIHNRGTVMRDEQGTPYRMLGAMMDVTASAETAQQLKIKNAELEKLIQEFTFVTDFMPQMVWATRPDGYHDFYNKRWYEFTGLTFEETKDRGWSLVLHPEDYERTWKIWQESLQTGRVYEVEYRMRRHDGVYRWFLARALPMRDEAGNIIKWFGTCTDIDDQKRQAEILEQKVKERTRELQQTNYELEVSNNELMQFASIASHDLKEPLRKIHIFSTMIRDRYMSEGSPAADYIDRIIRSSSRMTRLINDLLNYSRLSAEGLFRETDLNEVLAEVLGDIELAIADKGAEVSVGRLPVIEAIPGQMRQVFQNLISNSLKFTREGVQPRIEITAARIEALSFSAPEDEQGAYCRIELRDNGIGFDEQYAQKIFVIFQRLHTREKYDGTGIGLAITKKIIEKHHGIITAHGCENKGATFIMVLPLKQQVAVPVA